MICACLDDMHGQILISVLSVEGVKVGLEIPPILQTLRLHSLVISPFKQPLTNRKTCQAMERLHF